MDGLASALGSAQGKRFYFPSQTSVTAAFFSHWATPGSPGPSATPPTGTGAVPTSADSRFGFTNPTAPALTYLGRTAFVAVGFQAVLLIDRLWHNSGLDGTLATAQTINSVALTRPDAVGLGTIMFIEVYTSTGVTSRTATVSYTNTVGTAGQTSGAATIPASPPAGFVVPFPLATGDVGVKSIQSLTLSGSTGTAGNFGVTIARVLAAMPAPGSVPSARDVFTLGMPQVYDSACLSVIAFTTGTTTSTFAGDFVLVQG